MADIQNILRFWFGDPQVDDVSYAARRKLWFGKAPDFDATIHDRFLNDYQEAAAGNLDDWQTSAIGCLALLILLDQFPRNLFRGLPQAFATDSKALSIAQHAVDKGFDQQVKPIQRIFFYLPFEHSENLENQQRSVTFFQALQTEDLELADVAEYAVRHQVVIERFGRFPHRNQILGRTSTSEEVEFLKQPGSSF